MDPFLDKPLNIAEFKARVHNLLSLRWSTVLLKDRAKLLEEEVRKATSDIVMREHEALNVLGRVADYRDTETGAHVQRVGLYARLIAKLSGQDLKPTVLLSSSEKSWLVPSTRPLKQGDLVPDGKELKAHPLAVMVEGQFKDPLAGTPRPKWTPKFEMGPDGRPMPAPPESPERPEAPPPPQ